MPVRTTQSPSGEGNRPSLRGGALRLLLALLLPATLLLAGCAYFNTFYHAKKFFSQAEAMERNEAERAVQNASGGRSSTSQSTRSNDLYRKCIDKCEKVIQKYPGSKWEDDAYLLMGRAYYGKGDYLSARRELTRFPERFPKSDKVPEAMFWQGMTALAQDDFTGATDVWHALLETYPKYDERENVEYYLAEATERQGRTDAAITAYEEFLGRYPKGKRMVEARLRLGSLLLEEKRFEEAEEMFTTVATRAPEEEDRLEGRLRLGAALEAQDRYEEAYDLYVELELWLDPNVFEGRLSAEERKEMREAQLAAEVAAAQDSLLAARMNLQSEDDPDAERDDTFAFADDPNLGLPDDQNQGQTGTVGQTGINQTGTNPLNQNQKNQPNQQNQQNQQNQRKTLPPQDPKYLELAKVMLREGITLAELGKPWEAVLAYEQVIAEYPRTPYAAEAQYRIGYTQEVLLEDFDLAQQSYNAVASHGRSSFSEDATRRATNLKTVKSLLAASVSDSADVAAAKAAEARFLRAELFLFQQDKPERALEEYQAIEKEFAGTEQEAKAALAVAWVRMTALQDTARGRAKYADVMRNFPDTEYGRRATRLLKGPEREPELTDYAGPTVDELRAPENIAAVARRDSLLAAAEPPPPEPAGDAGPDSLDMGPSGPQGPGGLPGEPAPPGAGADAARSSVSDRQRQILERMRRGGGADSTGGPPPLAAAAGDSISGAAGSPPPGATEPGARPAATPGAGVSPVVVAPDSGATPVEGPPSTPGGPAPRPPAVTPGAVTPGAEDTLGEPAVGGAGDTGAETGAPAAETAAETGAPDAPPPLASAEAVTAAGADSLIAGNETPAAADTVTAIPEALPPPEDTARRPLPRGPSGKYLDPWAMPRAGWTPVLDAVPTDSTTVVPAEPSGAKAGGEGEGR